MNRFNISAEDSGRALHAVSDSSILPSISAGRKSGRSAVRSAVLTNCCLHMDQKFADVFASSVLHINGRFQPWFFFFFFWWSCTRSSSSSNPRCCAADVCFPWGQFVTLVNNYEPQSFSFFFFFASLIHDLKELQPIWVHYNVVFGLLVSCLQPWALPHMHAGQHAAVLSWRLVITHREDGAN